MANLLLILLCIFLGVGGQLCMKKGMSLVGIAGLNPGKMLIFLGRALSTPLVLAGFFAYALGSLIWLIIISRVDLSFAYPLISIGYILVAIFSWWLFNENINWMRWLGTVIIILGVILISRS